MPMKRKNKAPKARGRDQAEAWFNNNKARTDMRKKMAKASKKKNRSKK